MKLIGHMKSFLCLPLLVSASALADNPASELRVATWNAEHLALPIDAGCRPRTPEELTALQDYANKLDADIVALQEVASAQAVSQLFPAPEWNIIISEREDSPSYTCRGSERDSTQQKVAYAVRANIKVNDVTQLDDFALDRPGLRYGLQIDVETELGEMTLLNLHMKSGCFVDNYTRGDSESCATFGRQVPILDAWVDEQEKQDTPYIILGDFNHRLTAAYNTVTQTLTRGPDGNRNSLTNTTADVIGCHPYYPAPIDNILVGNAGTALTFDTQVKPFADMEVDNMLSDHCAIITHIEMQSQALSTAVKWQTTSKEYQALTSTIYAQATQQLAKIAPTDENWVVVMDVDETILDNSPYQENLDRTGQSYTSESWDAWVQQGSAELVPGVKGFIEAVILRGGKLGFVTNRNKSLDTYTWNNLTRHISALSAQNTCLMGRSGQDKASINQVTIINDKDLRRMQLAQGAAQCSNHSESESWQSPHQILMQVGDNIEDFARVTQHGADIDALLPELNKTLFLLPNAMYGSW